MHHMHITAMNVAIIRMGGDVNINDPITELDWDNWHYVERNNKTDDFRKCRRDLEELRKYVHTRRRRRQNTPRHGSRSRDDDETGEPPQRPEKLGKTWRGDVTLFQKLLKVNQSKLEEKQKRSMENMQKEKNLRASWKDRSLSIVAQTTQSRANS